MGPYTRIEGPEKLTIGTFTPEPVSTPELYLAWHLMQIQANGNVVKRWRALEQVQARVEHGRWIAICSCGVGMLTRPDWSLACCSWCGAVYHQVVFPHDYADIEHVLLERPKRENQGWLPHESLEHLVMENEQHAVELDAFKRLHGGEF